MSEVSIRDLRDHGGEVTERLERGERLTVTSDGRRVAELRPLDRVPVKASVLVERWSRLPRVDPEGLRRGPRCGDRLSPVTGPGILDTSTVVVLGRLDSGRLPEEPLITAVTLAELSVGPLVATTTAIANELPRYTLNPADFSGIDGLDLRAVPHPKQS